MQLRISLSILAAVASAALCLPTFASPSATTTVVQEKRDDKGDAKKREAPKEAPKEATEDDMKIASQMPLYPLDTCVISGEALGPEAKSFLVDGRLVRTCCGRCEAKIKGDSKEALAKIDAAIVRKQKAAYPMERCPVCTETLGEGAVDATHNTKLVRLCSEKCVAEFRKDTASSMKKLETAYIASQMKDYPLTNCLVLGDEALGADAVDSLYGTRLVRFCCKKCMKEFRANPEKFLVKLDEAAAAKKKS